MPISPARKSERRREHQAFPRRSAGEFPLAEGGAASADRLGNASAGVIYGRVSVREGSTEPRGISRKQGGGAQLASMCSARSSLPEAAPGERLHARWIFCGQRSRRNRGITSSQLMWFKN